MFNQMNINDAVNSINSSACISLTTDDLLVLIGANALLIVPVVLLTLLIWHGFILPVVNIYTDRWIDRQIKSGKLPAAYRAADHV